MKKFTTASFFELEISLLSLACGVFFKLYLLQVNSDDVFTVLMLMKLNCLFPELVPQPCVFVIYHSITFMKFSFSLTVAITVAHLLLSH